ncbi:MAG: DUF3303 family protein [Candidatus Poribacteria bacterium]
MKLHVNWNLFETVTGSALVGEVRQQVGPLIGKLTESGKMESHGVYADGRGGFIVLNVDSADEVLALLYPLHDFATIETRPIVSFQELGEFFESHAV